MILGVIGGFKGGYRGKSNSFNSMDSVNSMVYKPKNKKEKQLMKFYTRLSESYEDLMVEMKYESEFTNAGIKKEMNRLNKFYLDDFFKRAK